MNLKPIPMPLISYLSRVSSLCLFRVGLIILQTVSRNREMYYCVPLKGSQVESSNTYLMIILQATWSLTQDPTKRSRLEFPSSTIDLLSFRQALPVPRHPPALHTFTSIQPSIDRSCVQASPFLYLCQTASYLVVLDVRRIPS